MKNLIFLISISFIFMGCSKDKPETPGGLSQTGNDLFSITLSWNASEDADSYSLYRSADGIADFEIIYEGPNTDFTDTDLAYVTTYYYKVSAKNEVGESTLSLTISGSTAIPNGFDVTGSTLGAPDVDYTYNYAGDSNDGKPYYESDPWGLTIKTMSSGTFEGHWIFYYEIDNDVLYYHPDITDYPSLTGWLRYNDSETDIVLDPK